MELFSLLLLLKSIFIQINNCGDWKKKTDLSVWKQGKNRVPPSSVLLRSRIYHHRPRLASLSFFSRLLPFSVSFLPRAARGWVVNKPQRLAHPFPYISREFSPCTAHHWAFIPPAATGGLCSLEILEMKGRAKVLAFFFFTPPASPIPIYLVWLRCSFETQPVWLNFPFCR